MPFRGRVASVAGSDFDPPWISAPFIAQHSYDGMSLFFSGNDHRMYGLWYYSIPTLLEANQFSSPFFHLLNARLLNASGARDLRSYETQSMVNDRITALLGVRYLLSDKLLPDRTPVLSYRLVEGRDLHVYSVPDTNLAGYAVTKVRHNMPAGKLPSRCWQTLRLIRARPPSSRRRTNCRRWCRLTGAASWSSAAAIG